MADLSKQMNRSKCSGGSAQDNFSGIFDVRAASTEVNAQSMKDHESIFNNLLLSFEHLDKLIAYGGLAFRLITVCLRIFQIPTIIQ